MGKAAREGAYKTVNSPGPGAYDQRSRIEGPKCVIAGRHTQSVSSFVPGPGQYNPDSQLRQSSTAFKYSMAGRPASASRGNGAPGPGSYEVRVGAEKQGGAHFGKDLRKPLSQSFNVAVPGPGSYNPTGRAAKSGAAPQYS